MRKDYILLLMGAWVALLPYLGFPHSWKNILFTITGIGFIALGYVLYIEFKAKEIKKEKTFDNFKENNFEEGTETK